MQSYYGVDVSKPFLDIHCLALGETLRIPNTAEAIAQWVNTLENSAFVVMEATSNYHLPALEALQHANIPVSVVNPKRIRDFAKATGVLAKTDRLDAKVIAQFASQFRPQLQQSIPPPIRKLQALNAYRQDLVKDVTAHKNRFKQSREPVVQQSLKRLLEYLKQEIENVEQQIQQCIETDALLRRKAEVLKGVKGVGPVLCSTLLSHLPELGMLNEKRVAALAGVAPFNCDSGAYRGKRRIWGGRACVRHVLYLAANIARRYDPQMNTFFQRLIDKGKPFKVALTACMRKLLVILNAKMRDAFATPLENA